MYACSKGTEPEQVVQALSIVQDLLTERVCFSKSQSSLLNVYFLVASCPLSYLVTPAAVRIPVHTYLFSHMFK